MRSNAGGTHATRLQTCHIPMSRSLAIQMGKQPTNTLLVVTSQGVQASAELGVGGGGEGGADGGGSWEENDYACAPSLKERRLLLAAAHDIVSKEASQIRVLA